ncbi:DNA polymerase III subunit beta [Thiomonas delicata]|uniref:Beta sliding clamp n=1 Tax=Thiomonas delicata TaxID=364030 RepID=A0A238D1F7_THIDL|nr:DNA polymerase III subunit beta [Thiomonas delicata]SBP87034.1 DNA polymerase III, beta subunit [Thiomonas delicata]
MNRLTVSREALLKGLGGVAGIVERRQTLPVLANVLMQPVDADLALTTSDMEIQMRMRTTLGEGHAATADLQATTVNARKLIDILRAAPAPEAALEWADGKFTVRCGKSRFSLQTLPAEDFPLVKEAADYSAQPLVIGQGQFKRMLALVHFAMAQHDIRYYLNGLLLVADGHQLTLVSTDGHRLALVSAQVEGLAEKREVILPRKTVMELLRLLADGEEPIAMRFASNQAKLSFGDMELVSKLVEGKFPDYQRVVPKGHKNHLQLSRQTLLAALQRVAILTSDKFKGVRINLEPGALRISSTNAEQEEAQEELDVDYSGDPIEIGFNVAYLIDVLSNLPGETVRLDLQDGNSSVLMTLPDDASFKYVVMPMRI